MKLEDIIRCVGINPLYNAKNGDEYGMCNGYIYIPWSEEVSKIAIEGEELYPFEFRVSVHGGLTYGDVGPYAISDSHCPYSKILSLEEYTKKYIVVGWDTNHLDDNDTKWNYRTVIAENESLAEQILEVINARLKA